MAKLDEKMQLIGQAVVEQAEQESRSIIDKANAIRDRELTEYKEQVISKMFEQIQQKTRNVRQQAVRDRARAEQDSRRALLTGREELAALIYGSVRARLLEYIHGEEYRQTLLDSLQKLRDRWDHTSTTVQLRESDMALTDQIGGLLPGCRVEADKRIKLGGFRLRNTAAGILLDETLDARLEDTRPWFLQNCGLKVN